MYRQQSRNLSMNAIWIIMIANLLVYMVVLVEGQLIFDLGLQPGTWLERPWTIVTNMFVHGGLWHLLGNMVSLFFLGRFLISLTGETKFLIVYFLGGLAGNLVYIALGPEDTVAIGASGAVFAVGGALVSLIPNVRVLVFPIPAPVPLWVAIIGAFVVLSFLPNVAWQAHLGGLVFGLVLGYAFRGRRRSTFF